MAYSYMSELAQNHPAEVSSSIPTNIFYCDRINTIFKALLTKLLERDESEYISLSHIFHGQTTKIASNYFNYDSASRRIQRASKAFGSFQTNYPAPARLLVIISNLLLSGCDTTERKLGLDSFAFFQSGENDVVVHSCCMLLSFLRCRDCANKICKMTARRLIMMFLATKVETQSPHSTSHSYLLFKCLHGDGNRLCVVVLSCALWLQFTLWCFRQSRPSIAQYQSTRRSNLLYVGFFWDGGR